MPVMDRQAVHGHASKLPRKRRRESLNILYLKQDFTFLAFALARLGAGFVRLLTNQGGPRLNKGRTKPEATPDHLWVAQGCTDHFLSPTTTKTREVSSQ